MALPDYHVLMLPLLKLVDKRGTLKLRDAQQSIIDQFELTEEEKNTLLPSGKQTAIYNRIGWAGTYLRKSGLVSQAQRGMMEITPRGKKVLSENLASLNPKYLEKFAEFRQFKSTVTDSPSTQIINSIVASAGTPEEILEQAHAELKNQVLTDIAEKLKSCSPKFFENLVVDTLVQMGYGGSRKEAGKVIGGSGDEGIDGIINEDRLGLDLIYLQAKRWEATIGRPEIQKFAGALQGKRAKKGVFITTSNFTSEAMDFVKNIDAKIILISGKMLAELMWEYNIGVNISTTYEVKKIDFEYFSD